MQFSKFQTDIFDTIKRADQNITDRNNCKEGAKMIHSDCVSLIGSSHKICQDYSYADKDVIIVSDGCSSSKDTDIGARILTHCAKQILTGREVLRIPSWWDLGCDVTRAAQQAKNQMGLDMTVLDATLIAALRIDDRVIIYAYGDGTIAIADPDGFTYNIIDISFFSGAPYYLSYLLSSSRIERYQEEFPEGKKVSRSTVWCGPAWALAKQDTMDTEFNNFDDPFVYTIEHLKPGAKVAIFTDGLGTFTNDNGTIKPTQKWLVHDLMGFKNYNGEFVKRRATRVMKERMACNCQPYDDFSMAAMTIRPDTDLEPVKEKQEQMAGT